MRNLIRITAAALLFAVPALAQQSLTTTWQGTRVTNDGTTGTTTQRVAKVNASGNAITALTTDTTVPLYIVGRETAGTTSATTGSADLVVSGQALCDFDATAIAQGDFVQVSTTVAGKCHDAGASFPSSGGAILGIASTAGSGSTTQTVIAYSPGIIRGLSTTQIQIAGTSSGLITIQGQAAAGTYNFNLPTTAGSSGQVLTSGGGLTAPMTWGTGGGSSVGQWQVYQTPGSNVWTSVAGSTFVQTYFCAAGGGGGAGDSTATHTGGAGGGGGQCMLLNFKATDACAAGSCTLGTSTMTFTIGTGGTAGAVPAGNGGVGGSTTVTINGILYTAFGGGGGGGAAAAAVKGGGGGDLLAAGTTAGAGGANGWAGVSSTSTCGLSTAPLAGSSGGPTALGVGKAGCSGWSAGPGGGAGGENAGTNNGGNGGQSEGCATAPTGGTAGGAGGSTAPNLPYQVGCGGAGGAGINTTGTGGAGGLGTNAAGGGGGGSANAGGTGGAGAAGGNGFVAVRTW